jgi:hypothetical protein
VPLVGEVILGGNECPFREIGLREEHIALDPCLDSRQVETVGPIEGEVINGRSPGHEDLIVSRAPSQRQCVLE